MNARQLLSHKTVLLARAKFKESLKASVRDDVKNFSNDMERLDELACLPKSRQSIEVLRTLNLVNAEISALMEAFVRRHNKPIQDTVYAKFSFHIAYEFAKSRQSLFSKAFWLEVDSWQGTNRMAIKNELSKLSRLCELFVRDHKKIRDQSTGHRTSSSRTMSAYNTYFQFPFPLEDTFELLAQLAIVRRHICQSMLENSAHETASDQSHRQKPFRF